MSWRLEALGRQPYAPTLVAMRELAAAVASNDAPPTVWFVEHEPVYTAGRATSPSDLQAAQATGLEIVPIERGGKITYHGPGQLTVYPVVPVVPRDLRAWLRRIEQFGVAIARAFGVAALPSVDGTGVFAGEKKFASIGIAVRRWVSMHGIGINISMDLAPWQAVRPCGMSPEVMTDLSRAAGRSISMDLALAAAQAAVCELDPGAFRV